MKHVTCQLFNREGFLRDFSTMHQRTWKEREIMLFSSDLLNNDWVKFLLASRQNSNSHEPGIWHAFGYATSLSCHLSHIKPSVDYKSPCPLHSICRTNLSGGGIGHLCFATLIMDVSLMSLMCSNHLTVHLIPYVIWAPLRLRGQKKICHNVKHFSVAQYYTWLCTSLFAVYMHVCPDLLIYISND